MGPGIKKILGKEGEDAAAGFLKKLGYKIIERNYRYSNRGEIDIIAFDPEDKDLVFVEVKTRRSAYYGAPEFEVTYSKRQKIIKLAEGYIFSHKTGAKGFRFDVIAVNLTDSKNPVISHYKNSFQQ